LKGKASLVQQQSDPLKTMQEVLDARKEDFVLSPDEVDKLLKTSSSSFTDKTHLMKELVEHTGHLSLPPISNFRVSSAALGASGAIYVGVNVEFAGLPLPCSLHAEQFLILNALQHGETHLERIYISHLPCGHCRQFMCELQKSEKMEIHIVNMEGSFSLPELLPHRFTPRDLLGEAAYFLLQDHENELSWSAESKIALDEEEGEGTSLLLMKEMAAKALEEANRSYAQYSKCPSGICISDQEGNLYSGGVVESAAYNPTVSPLHAALVNGLIKGLKGWEEISHVLLVESATASVKHEHMVKEVLKHICPQATFSILSAETVVVSEEEEEEEKA
jgi:cytidine deaminase